jgi:hypothetical protein
LQRASICDQYKEIQSKEKQNEVCAIPGLYVAFFRSIFSGEG